MATTTPEEERERELRLVDNVDFKIISASNDTKKLQDVLTKFLAPLLLKAGSQHGAVRAKVSPDLRHWLAYSYMLRCIPLKSISDSFPGDTNSHEAADFHPTRWVSLPRQLPGHHSKR